MTPRTGLAMLAVGAALLAGCGSSRSGSGADSGAGASVGTPTAPAPPAVTGAVGTKPAIATPTGTPPTSLVSRDVVVGTGASAVAGKTLTVQYVGVTYADGKQFDASWDRNQPFSFPLGAGMVIPGWDQGLAGMKVGGRRELVIPPALGYGDQGAGPIAPGATLVFVIDLLKVA